MGAAGQYRIRRTAGVSLTSIIFLLAICGALLVLGMRLIPAFMEYSAVKNAIAQAKAAGGGPREMRQAFNKNAGVNDINAIDGKDLSITREGDETEISFEYEKRVPLFANATLLLTFSGSTDPSGKAAGTTAQADK